MNRAEAASLDASDPLGAFRSEFVIPDDELVYLDGNSLGRLPVATLDRVVETVADEWGHGLVRSWHDWIDRPTAIGDLLAPLLGAGPGEVLVCDQTSLNLFKLASAAVTEARPSIVSDTSNFPSDLYVLDEVARRAGGRLTLVDADDVLGPTAQQLRPHLTDDVGAVALSHVAFKSGAVADMAEITAAAHDAGALALWDLSHSAGALPVDLRGSGVDLAVGCTYKHLNGGPGSPAFLFVAEAHQLHLRQPIAGWWGHDSMFSFDLEFRPAPDIRRFAVGTPSMVALAATEQGVALTARAGITAIRSKNIGLTSLMVDMFDQLLAPAGFELGSPREPERRGSHVSVRHPDAHRITKAMIDRGVVPDFRAPDNIRLGVASLYTRYVDVWDAFETIAQIVESGEHVGYEDRISGVT